MHRFSELSIRRLISPGSRDEGPGLGIVLSFRRKYINKEKCINGPKGIEDINQGMLDGLVINFGSWGQGLGRPIVTNRPQ